MGGSCCLDVAPLILRALSSLVPEMPTIMPPDELSPQQGLLATGALGEWSGWDLRVRPAAPAGNLEIWKSGNLEIWKSWNLEI